MAWSMGHGEIQLAGGNEQGAAGRRELGTKN